MNVEEEILAILNREIARELMLEKKIELSEQELDEILEKCKGNPWDVPIMHELLKLMKEKQ